MRVLLWAIMVADKAQAPLFGNCPLQKEAVSPKMTSLPLGSLYVKPVDIEESQGLPRLAQEGSPLTIPDSD